MTTLFFSLLLSLCCFSVAFSPTMYCLNMTKARLDLSIDRGFVPNPLACNCPDTPLAGYYAVPAPSQFSSTFPSQMSFKCICALSLELFEWDDSPCRQENFASPYNCSEHFYMGCADPTGVFATVWLQENPGNFGMYLANTIKERVLGNFNVAWSLMRFGAKSTLASYGQPWNGARGMVYHGCYVDSPTRVLPEKYLKNSFMTVEMCMYNCRDYQYFGLEVGDECFCGTTKPTIVANRGDCSTKCKGNDAETCGADFRLDVYKIDVPNLSSRPSKMTEGMAMCQIPASCEGYTSITALAAPGGLFVLSFQPDGSLSVVDVFSNNAVIWTAPNHAGVPRTNNQKFVLQLDGNLVLYNGNGQPLWASDTTNGNYLTMQNDKNLVLYSSSNSPLWSCCTSVAPDLIPQVKNSPRFFPWLPEDGPAHLISNTNRNFQNALITCFARYLRPYIVTLEDANFVFDGADKTFYFRCLSTERAKAYYVWKGSPTPTAIANEANPMQGAGLYTITQELNFGYKLQESYDCVHNFYTFSTSCALGTTYPDVDLVAILASQTTTIEVLMSQPFDSVSCMGGSACQGSFSLSSSITRSWEASLTLSIEFSAETEVDAVFAKATLGLSVGISATVGMGGSSTVANTYSLEYNEPLDPSNPQIVIYFSKNLIKATTNALIYLFPSGTVQFRNPGFAGQEVAVQNLPIDFFYPVSQTGIGFPVRLSSVKVSQSYTTCIPNLGLLPPITCNF